MLSRLVARAEGLFWQGSRPLRRWLRARRADLAQLVARWRDRRPLGSPAPRFVGADGGGQPLRAPLVALPSCADRVFAAQSETSASADERAGETAGWLAVPGGALGAPWPRAQIEAMLLVGELEGLDWVVDSARGVALLRRPEPGAGVVAPLGKRADLPPLPGVPVPRGEPWPEPSPYAAAGGSAGNRRPRRRVSTLGRSWPPHASTEAPGALLLAPFVAVGGAERLMIDYVRRRRSFRRLVVATTDRHSPELGERLSDLHPLVPVFPFGDILARELHLEAVAILIERHRLASVVAWNGSNFFYEHAAELRRRFPALRLVNQIFDHASGWIRRLTPELVRVIDVEVAVNERIASELGAVRGVPGERIRIVSHGVEEPAAPDPDARERLRRELGVAPHEVLAVTLARLHPQKRPLDLLELAARTRGAAIRFLVVGGGPLAGECAREAARRGLDNLRLLPFDPEAVRWLDAADLCLLTSAHEGLPVFLLEGMARGTPFVATAVGGIPELAELGAGRIAPVGDLAALAGGLRELADGERRRVAGARARAVARERFGVDRFVAEMDRAIFGEAPE